MVLPVDQLYQTTVVVADLGAAAREYADFYGITTWRVADRDGVVSANGTNDSRGLTFELVERQQSGTYAGPEGVHSICVTRVAPAQLPELREWFASMQVEIAAVTVLGDGVEAVTFDTRDLLGGFMMQVAVSEAPEWQAAVRHDDTWDLSEQVSRPKVCDFVKETPGLNHFGVIVPDLAAVLPNFVRVFGLQRWRGYHWHTAPGSLEETTYMGLAAEHGFSTARGDVGRDIFGRGFGFEVVQPDFGPTHFADFLQRQGPGIHHLSLNLQMKDVFEWIEFQRWMETLGPVCMSGWLRDHVAMYNYSDLSERLGHVVESGIRRRSGHEPDRWYQFDEDGGLLQ